MRLQDATPAQRSLALRLWAVMVLGTLILLPFADRPLPNVPGFLPAYQTGAVAVCLITGWLVFGHFRAARLTPLLDLCVGYVYAACVLGMQVLSLEGVLVEGASFYGGPQARAWLWFFWHLGLALCILSFALRLGRGSSAASQATAGVVSIALLVLVAAVTATAWLAFFNEARLPVLDARGDLSRMVGSGAALSLQMLLVAAMVVLWRASRFRNVLHVWLAVVVTALLCDIALTTTAGGALTVGGYMGRIYALAGLAVIAFVYVTAMLQSHRINLALTDELVFSNSVLDSEIQQRTLDAIALVEAGNRKDEFLVMLAHELRNPLAPIRTASDLLAKGYHDEALVRKVSRMLNRQVMQMSRLVDDLMDMSRVARGRLVVRRNPVDMQQVIDDSVEQVTPLIQENQLTLNQQRPDRAVWIVGDPGRLVQVVTNLLTNAAKYTNAGGTIRLVLAIDELAGEAQVTVSDTGIGMSPEFVESAFVLFSQANVTPDRSRGGLGIGLALVKSIVELHQGSVHASSRGLGLGSEFTVAFPLGAEAGTPG